MKNAIKRWYDKKEKNAKMDIVEHFSVDEDVYAIKNNDGESQQNENPSNIDQEKFVAHVSVPSQKDIEQALLLRKKRELLEKYAIDSHMSDENETTDQLGTSS